MQYCLSRFFLPDKVIRLYPPSAFDAELKQELTVKSEGRLCLFPSTPYTSSLKRLIVQPTQVVVFHQAPCALLTSRLAVFLEEPSFYSRHYGVGALECLSALLRWFHCFCFCETVYYEIYNILLVKRRLLHKTSRFVFLQRLLPRWL